MTSITLYPMDVVCVPPPPVSFAEWEEEVAETGVEGTGTGAVVSSEGAASTNNGGSSGTSRPSGTFTGNLPAFRVSTISDVEAVSTERSPRLRCEPLLLEPGR